MLKNNDALMSLLMQRLDRLGIDGSRFSNEASEIIVFGSMSCGLQRPDSDLDVLCVGTTPGKVKRGMLDLIVVSPQETDDRVWRQSELAAHVAEYGIWLK